MTYYERRLVKQEYPDVDYCPQNCKNKCQSSLHVSEWNLKFDGDEEKLNRFLRQVELYAMAENVSKAELFRKRVFLFSGKILDFVLFYDEAQTWDDVVKAITKYCRGHLTFLDLFNKIENKRQGGQSAAAFISKMRMEWHSVKHSIPEAEMCDITIKGMRREMQTYLLPRKFNKFAELLEVAQMIERTVKDFPKKNEKY